MRMTNSRNKKVVRYILFEIERQRLGKSFDFESVAYNLEHIFPEHLGEEWGHIEEAKQERLIYRIVNMTPLETAVNRDLDNKSYDDTREEYRKSDFQITRSVAEHYDEWNGQKIDARQKKLADVARSIWRVDFGG